MSVVDAQLSMDARGGQIHWLQLELDLQVVVSFLM